MKIERAIADAAQALEALGNEHKRLSRKHRQLTRECKEKLARLRRVCEEYGIKLELQGEEESRGQRHTHS